MNKNKRKETKNQFEKLVQVKNKQKEKKMKKMDQTSRLRNTFLKKGQESLKVVNEQSLRVRMGKNKFIKVAPPFLRESP